MTTLLTIEVSPRGDYSTLRKLTSDFIEEWSAQHPGDTVVNRDLAQTHLPFVDLPWISGAFTPPEQHAPEIKAAIKVSDDLVAEFMAADHIVIGTPVYNFSIPATLKAYIDHIVRVGVTFTMHYEGLAMGKKATLILTSGGDFSLGTPYESSNLAVPYLRHILGFIGISDVNVVLAGRKVAVDAGEETLGEFAHQFSAQLQSAVQV